MDTGRDPFSSARTPAIPVNGADGDAEGEGDGVGVVVGVVWADGDVLAAADDGCVLGQSILGTGAGDAATPAPTCDFTIATPARPTANTATTPTAPI